jgi:MFS family permease
VGLGFVFDSFEIIVMPITVRPALLSFGVPPARVNIWVGVLLYVPAMAAGGFGLLGGYLLDRYGRRRVLVWSLSFYCLATIGASRASSPAALLFWRCATLSGVAVEFVAALTYLAELFPEPRLRERVLGFSQALYGVGNFAVTGAYYTAVSLAVQLPAINGHHDAWRYTLVAGAIPVIPMMLIRSRLPESPMWLARGRTAVLRSARITDVFDRRLRRATLAAGAVTALVYASTYGVLQHWARLVPGLPDVRLLPPRAQEQMVSVIQLFSALGDLSGRCLFAVIVTRFAAQRRLLRAFAVPSVIVLPLAFLLASTSGVTALKAACFAGALLVTAQLSFLGNYLPRVFPTHLRGTGESIAINVGGRMLGTSAAFLTPQLATLLHGPSPTAQLARAMSIMGACVSIACLTATRWLPEPPAQLPEDND